MQNSTRVLFFIFLLVSGLGAWINGTEVFTRLFFTSLLLLALAWLWTQLSLWRIGIKRSARLQRASVGDVFEERFELSNPTILPRIWLEARDASQLPASTGSRLITNFGGRQTRKYFARTWLLRRGRFNLGPTVLASGDPFGLFRKQREIPGDASVLVFPMILPLSRFPLPGGYLPGGRAISRKSPDITPHAAGVREYAPGDPLRRIHWPATARRERLMVKEFDQDPQSEAWIFLDLHAATHFEHRATQTAPAVDFLLARRPKITLPEATLEYAVTLAASLVHYFVAHRMSVGLACAGKAMAVLPAETGARQENKALETLAFVQADGQLPLNALVRAQAGQLPQGSNAILITASAGDEVSQAVEDLLRRNLRPTVLLLDARTFGGPPGADALAQKLAARAVPVCLLACGDNLPAKLAAMDGGRMTKDQGRRM